MRIIISQIQFEADEVIELSAKYISGIYNPPGTWLVPKRIIIPEAYGFNFAILSIKCMDKEQFQVPERYPSELFGYSDNIFKLDAIDKPENFRMKVENMSSQSHNFLAEILCDVKPEIVNHE